MSKKCNCMYCAKDKKLNDLMIEISNLKVSTLFLLKEQTYRGRCVVAFHEHKRELFELNDFELENFMKDISSVAQAINRAFSPNKINYAIYGDLVSHLHFHIVPKYEGDKNWGEAFEIMPINKIFLFENEYADIIKMIEDNLI